MTHTTTQTTVDRDQWRRFFAVAMATAVGLAAAVYAFVAIIDPWDILPLSPAWPRAPISSNQRFSFASLARSPKFDSVVVGTSTTRLLRPAALAASFGGAFVNLSMNAATPYEQVRLLSTFRRTHRHIRTVVWGIDYLRWCEVGAKGPQYMYLRFPEYMYGSSRWQNYRHVFSLYAVQEAFAQLAYMIGMRRPRFGLDGYANFLPDDRKYDAAKAATYLGRLAPPANSGPDPLRDLPVRFPQLDDLRATLSSLSADTLKLVVFTPIHLGNQPMPGSEGAKAVAACKFRIVELARDIPNTRVVDFMIDSPITRPATNYWDPLHYRVGLADRIVTDLAAAPKDRGARSPDYRLLH